MQSQASPKTPSGKTVPPINVLFLFMEKRAKVKVLLAEEPKSSVSGILTGFDEYMNLVLSEAEQIDHKTGEVRKLGSMLLKGDCVSMISHV
ncbi:mRNA splicing protein [Starmerella bacillaris]|uniref:Small nuclear ribonucleoprotein E n=1 Tax=Starmerella bacillaris TaxID=1247836 RepID=A0AAV5RRK8_STABA|nr:mRNA splicing protein [Starmerella bacillaris]